MSRKQLIIKWEELEFKFNKEYLDIPNIDEYSIEELKEEIEVLTHAIAELDI
jgi:hypothetical protein